MPNQSISSDIRRYAVAGAQARLTEMIQEAEAIRRAFPELRENRGPRRRADVAERGLAVSRSRHPRGGGAG